MSDQAIIEKLALVWQSITDLCTPCSASDWQTPTDCPGWTVQDQMAHLIGGESRLLGLPAPEHTPQDLSHVKNDAGQRNEIWVDWHRSWTGAQVLARFRALTAERLRRLGALRPEEFDAATQTPIGPGTLRDLLNIRIFDAWVHEQDMRRALGRPGHLTGPVAEHAVERVAMAMPYVIGRKVKPADGSTVVFTMPGATGRSIAVRMENGRAQELRDIPSVPTVRLSLDAETFTCLGCGRGAAEAMLQAGRLKIAGDMTLGQTIVAQMNIMI